MGPQVGYYTPEIFLEYELHGPGIDESGVSFPGSSPYALIGHGILRVDRDLCLLGQRGRVRRATLQSRRLTALLRLHALPVPRPVHGLRRPRRGRDQAGGADQPEPSVDRHAARAQLGHGPIASLATVHGAPVALAVSAATRNHQVQSYVAFMRLAENVPTSPQSFVSAMRIYTGSENWFYVDRRHIGVLQAGWFPSRRGAATGTCRSGAPAGGIGVASRR